MDGNLGGSAAVTATGRERLLRIIDLARWAPSGDNTQPWRFEIVADDALIVHGHDTRDEVLYDFDGHASHIAHGALLETMRIAASAEGLALAWTHMADAEDRHIEYRVQFSPSAEVKVDPLFPFVEKRVVQRRPMRTTPLTETQRSALLAAAGDGYTLQLFESVAERRAIAGILWDNAYIRLTCPEAFPVHQRIIEWGARFSKDRIPEQAVGVDPLTAKLMHWVMQSWERVSFFNRYLMGTILPRVQLDYLPALSCAAHLLIKPKMPPGRLEDWIRLGQTVQRVWLTATQQNLHLQPQMTPVIFRWYARAGRKISRDPAFAGLLQALAAHFERVSNTAKDESLGFFCRIGSSAEPEGRSLRIDVSDLTQ